VFIGLCLLAFLKLSSLSADTYDEEELERYTPKVRLCGIEMVRPGRSDHKYIEIIGRADEACWASVKQPTGTESMKNSLSIIGSL
jgi:hypothetical protein